jgi:hypothetical protein
LSVEASFECVVTKKQYSPSGRVGLSGPERVFIAVDKDRFHPCDESKKAQLQMKLGSSYYKIVE